MRAPRRRYALGFVLAFCSGVLVSAPVFGTPISVVAIGDSITAGDSSQPSGPGWVDVLAAELGPDYSFANLGKGGFTSLDWTGLNSGPDYFEVFVESMLPVDIVMIMLGTNDAASVGEPAPVSTSQYREAIENLVGRSLAAGVDWVVLTAPPPAWYSNRGEGLIFHYQSIIAEICTTTAHVHCGPDLYGQLIRGLPDFAPFDVHPTGVGHVKIADAFAPTLRAIPEPETGLLFGGGLSVLAILRRNCG
jgi:lysophospholipase L1-like esterase